MCTVQYMMSCSPSRRHVVPHFPSTQQEVHKLAYPRKSASLLHMQNKPDLFFHKRSTAKWTTLVNPGRQDKATSLAQIVPRICQYISIIIAEVGWYKTNLHHSSIMPQVGLIFHDHRRWSARHHQILMIKSVNKRERDKEITPCRQGQDATFDLKANVQKERGLLTLPVIQFQGKLNLSGDTETA